MKKLLYFVLFLFGLVASSAAQPAGVYGQSNCTPLYGGGEDCPPSVDITLDKAVHNPDTDTFVNNLGLSDHLFSPNQTVIYRVVVENLTDQVVSDVQVADTLPGHIEFVSGPGTFDAATSRIEFAIASLGAREKRAFDIHGRVADIENLPNTRTNCVVNVATAEADETHARDTAQLCIQRDVLGVTELPATGAEGTIAVVAGLATLFVIGRRLAKVH